MIKTIIIIVLLLLLFQGNQIKKITEEQKQEIQETQELKDVCSILISQAQIEIGEIVKGEITTEPATDCDVYYKAPLLIGWNFAGTFKTGDDGKLSYENALYIPGTYHFITICKTTPNCKSNEEILSVA